MEWEPQLILDELSASTANGAPLWVLSPRRDLTRFPAFSGHQPDGPVSNFL